MPNSDTQSVTEYAESKLTRQEELEDKAVARGAHRFDRRLEETRKKDLESTHGAAKNLLIKGWPKMAEGLRHWLDDQTTGPGRRHTAVKWLQKVGVEKAAAITTKVVLDGIHSDRIFRKVCFAISDRILMELRSRRLEEEAPGLFKYRVRSFKNTSHYRHMRASMQATIRYSDVEMPELEMTKSHKMRLGTKLLDILQQTIGLIEIENVADRKPGGGYKQQKMVRPDAQTREWISQRNGLLRDHWPVYGPMVVPPLEWKDGERGGYRYALRGEMDLVRGSDVNKQDPDQDLSEVYDALNSAQETAWCVNLRVLEAVQEVADRGGGRADVPELEEIPEPPKPEDIDENEEAREEWKEKARRRHLRERERQGNAATFLKTLNTIEELEDEEELFFPYSLDFRGRVYPIPDTLHPQGPDLHRGLLQFAEGQKLGRDGAMWLCVHGANCLGETPSGRKLDKESFQARCDWVTRNSGRIVEVAEAPLEHTWWMDADEPWQFLAFAYEWKRFVRHRKRGKDDEEFVSWLPVAVDGSCNGLQHFAALLRDRKGGEAVNLLPSDSPRDFYTRVLEATKDELESIAASGEEPLDELAAKWLGSGLLERSIVKRPSMTFSYGSQEYGFTQQIKEYLKSNTDWHGETKELFAMMVEGEPQDMRYKACNVLAKAIWRSIGDEASGAFRAMEWLQDCARVVAKSGDEEGQRVSWTVPETGFEVTQNYTKDDLKQVDTVLSGTVIQPSYYAETDDVDSRKQGNACPPNVIHSLDAANLVMTVNRAVEQGVSHVGVVHDSFQTHAGDMTVLGRAIRETFVELHSGPILEDLEAQFRAQADDPEDIPEPPARGDLDLGKVLVSEYFFS